MDEPGLRLAAKLNNEPWQKSWWLAGSRNRSRLSTARSPAGIFFALFTTAAVLLGLGFVLYLQFASEFDRRLAEKEESYRIEHAAGVFTDILDDIVGDLLFLSQSENLQRYLHSRKPLLDWTYLAKEMVSYAKAEQVYDRIRFIDDTGKELIRVDFNAGAPAIIPRGQLRDRSQRDYVKESSQLDKGDVYISRLALDRENGKVLLPHKPLLRVATPVYDGRHKKRGVLVLSYSAATLFERIKDSTERSPGKVTLLDYQGHWLMGGEPEYRWAFMFQLEHSLALRRPDLWRRIQQGVSGSQRREGWSYLYRNIRLAKVNSPTPSALSVAERLSGPAEWTLLAALAPKPLFDRRDEGFPEALGLFLILLGIIATVSFIAAQLWIRTLQQKAAEKLTSSVFNTVSDAILVADGEHRIMAVNPAFFHVTGYGAEEVMGRNANLLQPGHQDAGSYRRMWDGLKQNGSWEGELLGRRKDGSLCPVRLSIVAVTDSQGQVQRHVSVFHDISERKQIEDDLKQARDTAEAAANAKSVFLANMGHEIRTPLNTILGMSYLLQRDGLSSGQAQKVDRIDTAGHLLLELINNILELTKVDSKEAVLEKEEIDLDSIIRNVASQIRQQAVIKGLQLLIEPPPVSVTLIGDPKRLTQALSNLAANAVKFTDQGSITLKVELLEESGDNVLVRFVVTDTGIGVDPGVQTRLFTAFEQVDGSSTRHHGGTGLGLSIVKLLAQRMGGTAGVDSQPGQGSTFWFTARLAKGSIQRQPNHSSESLDDTLEPPLMQHATPLSADSMDGEIPRLLQQLEALLEMNDTSVNKVSLEHEALLFRALDQSALKLKNEIESFDYEGALITVRECIGSGGSDAE